MTQCLCFQMIDEMLQTELWDNRERRSLFLRVPFKSLHLHHPSPFGLRMAGHPPSGTRKEVGLTGVVTADERRRAKSMNFLRASLLKEMCLPGFSELHVFSFCKKPLASTLCYNLTHTCYSKINDLQWSCAERCNVGNETALEAMRG